LGFQILINGQKRVSKLIQIGFKRLVPVGQIFPTKLGREKLGETLDLF